MKNFVRFAAVLFWALALGAAKTAFAAGATEAQMVVHVDQPGPVIHREVYGQFAEQLGRGIDEGIWVGVDSPIPNIRGYRKDVVEALKAIHVPVVRWPGGCYADEYHWRDGIGPRAQRPVRPNQSWGGEDRNVFGTHEFMDFAELIGAETYIGMNVGSGSAREMADWLEYVTANGKSSLALERKSNGRDKPWKLDYVGVGNEAWGCGGHMRPTYYADLYRQFATFVRSSSGTALSRVASGANADDVAWTEGVLSVAAELIDVYSVHYYTLPSGEWKHKGSATAFGEADWIATLRNALRMDAIINMHAAILDKYDPAKRIVLAVDEWGTWYDSEPGQSPLYQQNSLRDALTAAVTLNIFHAHADRVRLANIAQMVNVLQSMILTDREKMVLTPTYHVFDLYKVFQDAASLPFELQAPDYALGAVKVPGLHASAARDASGGVHIALVNLNPNQAAELKLQLKGFAPKQVSGRLLTAAEITSVNTFDKGGTVRPSAYSGASLQSQGAVRATLPEKSVVVLDLK